jgi:hypothetical protein
MHWLSRCLGLVHLAAACLAGLHPAVAQDAPIKEAAPAEPGRAGSHRLELLLPAANPAASADANRCAYITCARLSGKGVELLSDEIGIASYGLGRVAEVGTTLTLDSLFYAISHELAHKRSANEVGIRTTVDIKPFRYGLLSSGDTEFQYVPPDVTLAERAMVSAAGVNQGQLNATETWRRTRNGACVTDDISYIYNRLALVAQGWRFDTRDNDISHYVTFLNTQGLNVSHDTLKRNSVAMSILDVPLWEAFCHLSDFLIEGRRRHEPFRVDLGNGWSLHPPHVESYLAGQGEFVNATASLSSDGGFWVHLSLGSDLDATQKLALLDLRRAGIWVVIPAGPVTVSPFVAIDTDSRLHDCRGRAIGSELRVPLFEQVGIEATVMNARNDLIENTIKDRRNGWYGFFCVSLSF